MCSLSPFSMNIIILYLFYLQIYVKLLYICIICMGIDWDKLTSYFFFNVTMDFNIYDFSSAVNHMIFIL